MYLKSWLFSILFLILNLNLSYANNLKCQNLYVYNEKCCKITDPEFQKTLLNFLQPNKRNEFKNSDLIKNQFITYLNIKFKDNLNYFFEIGTYKLKLKINELSRDFFNIYKKYNPSPDFEKKEEGIFLVTSDYEKSLSNKSYLEVRKWKQKINKFYWNDYLWRGLGWGKVLTQVEILNFFKSLTPRLMSNRINFEGFDNLNEVQLQKLLQVDFENYNNDFINGNLSDMASTQQAGSVSKDYFSSYGLSTSMDSYVANSFTSKVIPGQTLQSRVVFGFMRPKASIDLIYLPTVDSKYINPFARQEREVICIGGIDPDAIQIVQISDPNRENNETYIRDPENPAIIHRFKNHIKYFNDPNGIYIQTYNLTEN